MNPDHLGCGCLDPRQQLGRPGAQGGSVDLPERCCSQQRHDVVPDLAAHRGGGRWFIRPVRPPVLLDVLAEGERSVAGVDELATCGVGSRIREPLLRVLARVERAVPDARNTLHPVALALAPQGCSLPLPGVLAGLLLEPAVFYVPRQGKVLLQSQYEFLYGMVGICASARRKVEVLPSDLCTAFNECELRAAPASDGGGCEQRWNVNPPAPAL